MTSAAAPAWRLRAIGDAGFEWTYRLHEAALGEHIEQIWGWDEELQPQMFTEAFHRQERQVIVVGADDVGVLAVEERPDELYLALLELLPAWQGKGLGAGTPMKLAPRSSTSSTTGATKPTKPSSWRRRTPRQPAASRRGARALAS